MVGLNIFGLLGNHMFQYAAIYAISKKLNSPFFIRYGKSRMTKPRLHDYFKLYSFNKYTNFYRKSISKLDQLKEIQISNQINPIKQLDFGDKAIYTGYFQSSLYFKDYYHEISDEFKVKLKYSDMFISKYGDLYKKNKIIAIHLRRTSYENFGGKELGGKNLTLPLGFYKNCLSKIKNREDYKIIFVSDDIDFVKKNFERRENYLFEENDEIIDFQILLNANKLIIANSTFSWWAAYLNKKKDKKVYAPKYWLGFKVKEEFPKGVSVIDWTWVDVNIT